MNLCDLIIALNSACSLLVANSICFSKLELIVFAWVLHDESSSSWVFVLNGKAQEGNIIMQISRHVVLFQHHGRKHVPAGSSLAGGVFSSNSPPSQYLTLGHEDMFI